MEAVKKQTLFSVLFGTVTTFSEGTIEITDKYQIETLNNLKIKENEVNEAIHSENKSSNSSGKSGGLGNKIKTPTIDVHEMSSEKLEEMRKKLQGRERE